MNHFCAVVPCLTFLPRLPPYPTHTHTHTHRQAEWVDLFLLINIPLGAEREEEILPLTYSSDVFLSFNSIFHFIIYFF